VEIPDHIDALRRRLVRIIRRGSGSVVTRRRAQMVLMDAGGSIFTSSEVDGRLAPPMGRVVTHFVPTAGGWVSSAGPSICPSTTPFCHSLNRAGSVA